MDDAPETPAPAPALTLAEAEAALAALEGPRQAVDQARRALRKAEFTGEADAIAEAKAAHDAALQAHAEAAIDPRQIDLAAQAVIDARPKTEAGEGE